MLVGCRVVSSRLVVDGRLLASKHEKEAGATLALANKEIDKKMTTARTSRKDKDTAERSRTNIVSRE